MVADFKQTEAAHVTPPAQMLATPIDLTSRHCMIIKRDKLLIVAFVLFSFPLKRFSFYKFLTISLSFLYNFRFIT